MLVRLKGDKTVLNFDKPVVLPVNEFNKMSINQIKNTYWSFIN